jgi:hypothetical protein
MGSELKAWRVEVEVEVEVEIQYFNISSISVFLLHLPQQKKNAIRYKTRYQRPDF